jgi:hypothetical protein
MLWILQGWIDTLAASDCLHCAGRRLPWSYTARLPEVRVNSNEFWMCFLVFNCLLAVLFGVGILGSFISASTALSYLRFLFVRF